MDGMAAPRGDPTSADFKSADAQTQGGKTEEGRQGPHKDASPSPRCHFQWVEEHLAGTIAEMEEKEDTPYIVNERLWYSLVVAKHACQHVISRGGHILCRLEDLCSVFLFVQDLCSGQVEVQVCGPPKGCALAQFAVEAIVACCFSILDSLGHLGF